MEQSAHISFATTQLDTEVWLKNLCRKSGLGITDGQVHMLSTYTHRLLEWNTKVNLISRKDTENVWKAHILHSLSIPLMIDIPEKMSVLDLGSGGGLPGVVLGIARPDLRIVCLDATRKKMDAVQKIIESVGVKNISVAWGRAEELGRAPMFHKKFQIVVARAVASLRDLVRWSKPFLADRRILREVSPARRELSPPALLALKGGDLTQEIKQAQTAVPDISIREYDLVFHGAEEISGVEKRLVIVEF